VCVDLNQWHLYQRSPLIQLFHSHCPSKFFGNFVFSRYSFSQSALGIKPRVACSILLLPLKQSLRPHGYRATPSSWFYSLLAWANQSWLVGDYYSSISFAWVLQGSSYGRVRGPHRAGTSAQVFLIKISIKGSRHGGEIYEKTFNRNFWKSFAFCESCYSWIHKVKQYRWEGHFQRRMQAERKLWGKDRRNLELCYR